VNGWRFEEFKDMRLDEIEEPHYLFWQPADQSSVRFSWVVDDETDPVSSPTWGLVPSIDEDRPSTRKRCFEH